MKKPLKYYCCSCPSLTSACCWRIFLPQIFLSSETLSHCNFTHHWASTILIVPHQSAVVPSVQRLCILNLQPSLRLLLSYFQVVPRDLFDPVGPHCRTVALFFANVAMNLVQRAKAKEIKFHEIFVLMQSMRWAIGKLLSRKSFSYTWYITQVDK
jgi:hypothetical protein